MMQLLQKIVGLVIFICLAAFMLSAGLILALVVLAVGLVVAVWYGIKLQRIRSELTETLREHQRTSFSDAMRRDEKGEIIEVEYHEVIETEKER